MFWAGRGQSYTEAGFLDNKIANYIVGVGMGGGGGGGDYAELAFPEYVLR